MTGRHFSRRHIVLGGLSALVTPLACRGEAQPAQSTPAPSRGDPRSFRLGLSSLPAEATDFGYEEAFRLAGLTSEVILIQRAPPWSDFLPGRTISGRTEGLTRLEKELAAENGLKLFLAVDVTDPADRSRLASPPRGLEKADFSHPDVRAALVAYVRYLALNYQPAYLAIGVEMDLFFSGRGDAAFRNFQSVYFEAYDAARKESGETLIFPTFQYENMLGLLNPSRQATPAWALVQRFDPKLDRLAVSSYPSAVFAETAAMPVDYYAPLQERQQRGIIFASTGWPSHPAEGQHGLDGEKEQAEFLQRLLTAAGEMNAELVVWYLARDQSLTAPGFEPLASMGLQGLDGEEKLAYVAWRAASERPRPAD